MTIRKIGKTCLASVTASYNAAFHEAIGYSPFFVMFGRDYRTPIDLAMGLGTQPYSATTTVDYVDQLQERLRIAYNHVNDRLKTYTARMKQRYDCKVKEVKLEEGGFAMYYVPQRRIGRNQKWRRLCKVVLVVRRFNDVLYSIQVTPRSTPTVAHADRLRPFNGEVPSVWAKYAQRAGASSREETPVPTTDVGTQGGTGTVSSTDTGAEVATAASVPLSHRRSVLPTAGPTAWEANFAGRTNRTQGEANCCQQPQRGQRLEQPTRSAATHRRRHRGLRRGSGQLRWQQRTGSGRHGDTALYRFAAHAAVGADR